MLKKIIIALLLAVIGVGVFYLARGRQEAVPVRILTVSRGDFTVSVSSATTSTVKSEREINISPQRSGRLIAFSLREGDTVKKGQVVARLDNREVELQVSQARAALRQAEDRLGLIQAEINLARETAKAQIAEAKAALDEAGLDLARKRQLVEQGMISRQEMDTAVKNEGVAQARYEHAMANRLQERIKEEELAATRARVKELEASLALTRLTVEYGTIYSPIDGVVSKKLAEQGEYIGVGTPVFRLTDPRDLYIEVAIDEFDAKYLKTGQKTKVRMDAFPGREFAGSVVLVSPIVIGEKQQTRTFLLRVLMDDKTVLIVPGMSADVEVIAETVNDVISIPTSSIVEKGGKMVYVVTDEKRAVLTPITRGVTTWHSTEVVSGISEGQKIVANPEVLNLKDNVLISE